MDIIELLNNKKLDSSLAERFRRLTAEELEWNEKINVTAIRDPEEFMARNIMDSLTVCGREEIEAASLIMDMGTGGGFPGLPLAMVYPDKHFVLVDTIGKKLSVVNALAESLGITNIETIHARAEDLARDAAHREKYDLVLSRAVANMSTLCEYCLPFVKTGGSFTAYKTETSAEEIAAAASAVKKLGGEAKPFESDGIEGSGHGFVRVLKTGHTPKAYPRKAGTPLRQPL